VDIGQAIFISSRLILGAAAAFLAILVWAKTRDKEWMFMVIAIVIAYIEIIYSILNMYGFITMNRILIGSVPLFELIMPALRMGFFIAAFYVMVIRRRRR
jgi:hypothetical protein